MSKINYFKNVMPMGAVAIVTLSIAQVQATVVTVPNASFELLYEPGSTTSTADIGNGWTNGVGPSTPMQSGQTASYSGGGSGGTVDIPGWVNAPGWPEAYDWTQGSGSIAKQNAAADGLHYFTANGGTWGNAPGGAIVSAASLGAIDVNLTYTLSAQMFGPVTFPLLELLADGVPLTPASVADPTATNAWEEVSRTYDATSLAGHDGQSLTIRLGWGTDGSPVTEGSQSRADMVMLSYVPEPATISLLVLGGLAMLRRKRR
jgi:hypothetical protein